MNRIFTTLTTVAAAAMLSASMSAAETLDVTAFTINGTDMLAPSPVLAQLQGKDPIEIHINPIPDAVMLSLEFAEKISDTEKGEIIRKMEIYNIPTNPSVKVDPATGTYETVVAGKAVNKFYDDREYVATITGYSTTNSYNPGNQTWGPVAITFRGGSESYKFSDVTFVSVTPPDHSEITDTSTPVVVTFSGPVESVACKATTGGQGASQTTFSDITPNADKTVWTIRPGKSFWSGSGAEWTFSISAKDAEGRTVKGNSGTEAGSYYAVVYGCYFTWPAVNISPASGMVEQLYEFTATETTATARGIGFSYNAVPYVVNEAGETVARVDTGSQVLYDAVGQVIDTDGDDMSDVIAVKTVFHLNEAVTEPGKYTLIIPRSTFAIGAQYNSDMNRYMEIDYQVIKMPKVAVNVELVNFATTSFEVLEGRDAKVRLTPSEDWKLATLTLNGEDVTTGVVDNAYVIAGVKEEANLVATYEFAQDVEVTQSGSVSVETVGGETHEYTVASQDDVIKVGNLLEGDVVRVYTLNGMTLANTVATKSTMSISVPKGQTYVVMVNGAAIKIMH